MQVESPANSILPEAAVDPRSDPDVVGGRLQTLKIERDPRLDLGERAPAEGRSGTPRLGLHQIHLYV